MISKFKVIGLLLLGLVAGVLLCHFVAPLRGLRDAVSTGLWGGDGPDHRARWFLSGPGTEDHWRYGVEFDASGLVLHKWLEFWWD